MANGLREIGRYIFSKRLNSLASPLTRIQKRWTKDGLYSKEEFRAIVERECARADRNGSRFSLVVFDVSHTDADQTVERRLTKIIRQRVRSTDEVGRVDRRHIGIDLPDTPAEGARKLAIDIYERIATGKLALTFKIYTYPLESLPGLGDNLLNQRLAKADTDKLVESAIQSTQVRMQPSKNLGEDFDLFLVRGIPPWKRGIDILGSALGFLLLSPVFLIIGALIKIVSPGPVLFKQTRVGYLGKPFTMLKFRTMKANADPSLHMQHVTKLINGDEPLTKLDNRDPRIIPFGKTLRLTGLDELPQLVNVLRGEMSLVGPRPELPSSVCYCHQWHSKRFHTKPGLSGLWQVSNRSSKTFNEMMRLDVSYVKQMSFWFDTMILFKTLPTILIEMADQHLIFTRSLIWGRNESLGKSHN
jgi:lipopolysaccharide/colanic/teichoic acid biosynthesis glycosyltransferase